MCGVFPFDVCDRKVGSDRREGQLKGSKSLSGVEGENGEMICDATRRRVERDTRSRVTQGLVTRHRIRCIGCICRRCLYQGVFASTFPVFSFFLFFVFSEEITPYRSIHSCKID